MRKSVKNYRLVLFSVFLLLILFKNPMQVEAVEFTTADTSVVMVTTDGASVYSQPDTTSTLIVVVGKGIPVQVTGITSNSWFRVDVAGSVLYMPATALIANNAAGTAAGTFVPLQSTPEYTVTVHSLEEALSAVDMMIPMRIRKLELLCDSKVKRMIYDPAYARLRTIFYESLRNYNAADMHEIRHGVTDNGYVLRIDYGSLEKEAAVESAVAGIYAKLNKGSTYDKVLAVHDYLCNHVNYVEDESDCYRAYGALVNGTAVCEGYALAFQRIMDSMGIPCYVASGTYKGGAHAWNIVQVDGQWYHLDVTIDDQDWGIAREFFLVPGTKLGYTTWGNGATTVNMATTKYVP